MSGYSESRNVNVVTESELGGREGTKLAGSETKLERKSVTTHISSHPHHKGTSATQAITDELVFSAETAKCFLPSPRSFNSTM